LTSTVLYIQMKRYFEWDEKKAVRNLRKHGIAFEDALLVFNDPLSHSKVERVEHGQECWQTVGLFKGFLLLYVAHTLHLEEDEGGIVEVVRIISARRATNIERKRYEHG